MTPVGFELQGSNTKYKKLKDKPVTSIIVSAFNSLSFVLLPRR
jgi:hypothetical protein